MGGLASLLREAAEELREISGGCCEVPIRAADSPLLLPPPTQRCRSCARSKQIETHRQEAAFSPPPTAATLSGRGRDTRQPMTPRPPQPLHHRNRAFRVADAEPPLRIGRRVDISAS
ncbi:Hypothetical predicted protein [Podarcis lilfordi]|uniref:Uncharacterized protein n=1 Tax=Podarcis lilfordi TaxID=74358 RepID=A0AA35JW78_9SAUR|nr:Hypothetical predicted protein [Podarcis lilfordi]